MLVTRGKQPLMPYAIESLLSQIQDDDEFTISVNSSDPDVLIAVRKIVDSSDASGRIKLISPSKEVSVYEHYRFAFSKALHDCAILVHDDDLYGSTTVSEVKRGFSCPEVNVVVGGMLKVEVYSTGYRLQKHVEFTDEGVYAGLPWVLAQDALYPPFCFSALAVRRSALQMDIFSPIGTAVDCLVVAHQAIVGKVYQSKKILATWMQLPTRTSRWACINPALTTPWKEFLEYYNKIGHPDLIRKAIASKRDFLKSFVKMVFIVGVANRDVKQINGSLIKIGEINRTVMNILGFARWPVVYHLAGPVLQVVKSAFRWRNERTQRLDVTSMKGAELLGVDSGLWLRFVKSAMELAER